MRKRTTAYGYDSHTKRQRVNLQVQDIGVPEDTDKVISPFSIERKDSIQFVKEIYTPIIDNLYWDYDRWCELDHVFVQGAITVEVPYNNLKRLDIRGSYMYKLDIRGNPELEILGLPNEIRRIYIDVGLYQKIKNYIDSVTNFINIVY